MITHVPLKRLARLAMGETILAEECTGHGLPIYSANSSGAPWNWSTHFKRRLCRGTLVVSARGTIGAPRLPEAEEFGCTQTTISVVPGEELDARYLRYVLSLVDWKGIAEGMGIPMLTVGTLGEQTVRLRPPAEQRVIADYLDSETARIDMLIEEQRHLIEMLTERRQAEIDAAFSTLGDPTVQLRRYITFLTSGSRGWGDYYAVEGERFLRIGNLPRANLSIRGDVQFVDLPDTVTEGARTILREGDLLFSITAYLGSVAVVEGDWVGAYVSQHVALCRLNDRVDPRFLGWFMLTTTGRDQLNEGAVGGTKVQLALDDIRGLRVPTAPLHDQSRIAAHLDEQTARIDELISEMERFIELSRERRSALITAAVTGQIDVRNEVA